MSIRHLIVTGMIAVLALTARASSSVEIPRDLAVRAQFYPGAGGEWLDPDIAPKLPKPWWVTIAADGTASQSATSVHDPARSLPLLMRTDPSDHVSPEEMRRAETPRTKRRQISAQELQRIVVAVQEARFFALPRHLSSERGEHAASVVLRVTMSGHTREVVFDWPNERFDRQGLLRFWRVWSAVTHAAPSPNHNDELDYWTHAVGLRLPKQI